MSFPWLHPTTAATDSSARKRLDMLRREIAQRAAVFYRLGYSSDAAVRRLAANLAWEFDPHGRDGRHGRPAELDDAAVTAIVATTYARRPS